MGCLEQIRRPPLGFVPDDAVQKRIEQLREHFLKPRSIARIVGLSGLGKTRLALEVFRPPNNSTPDPVQRALTRKVVYVDAAAVGGGASLPSVLTEWRNFGQAAIVVVDDCDLEAHRKLVREVEHADSKLSLLTLDFETGKPSGSHPLIELAPASEDVIRGMLKQAYPGLRDPDISRIVDFAQGFPKMATLLAEARLAEEPTIGSLSDDVLLKRLLWGRAPSNADAYKVISACSLFERVGFRDDRTGDRDYLAEKICNLDADSFHAHAIQFMKQGILEQRGRFIRVKPRPLAIRLAADWWQSVLPAKAKGLIEGEMPPGLAEALCDQMAKLDFLPEAQRLVEALCGEQGPFGQAETLNSERGSRLLRSLVEVNPEACVSAIERAFGHLTREQLQAVGPGRRNLVWALEKLCFWENTFRRAARLMLMFAEAENETWANNATAQFRQLYQVFLSGTQAPPSARLAIIDEALTSSSEERKPVILQALGVGLKTHHFSRMGGVERQGSGPPRQEWHPKVWGDVFEYWRACLERLTPVACGNDDLAEHARAKITKNILGLVQYGRMRELETALSAIVGARRTFWPAAYEAVSTALDRAGERMPEEGRLRLKAWLEMLRPQTLRDRLQAVVTAPGIAGSRIEGGLVIDIGDERARQLAKECSENPDELIQELEGLLTGEQRYAYSFGRELANDLGQPEVFIARAMSILRTLSEADANPALLGGMLATLQQRTPALVRETLDEVAQDANLRASLVELTRGIDPQAEDLDRLWSLIEEGHIEVRRVRAFTMGRIFARTNLNATLSFCEKLAHHGIEGAWIALDILVGLSYSNPDVWLECKNTVRQVLLVNGILSSRQIDATSNGYMFQEVAKKLLEADMDNELAQQLSREIVAVASTDDFPYGAHYALTPVIRLLLDKYRQIAWPVLGAALLSESWVTHWNMTHLLGPGVSPHDSDEHGVLFFTLPTEFLLDWSSQHSESGPPIIARLMPVFEESDEHVSLHEFARALLDRFGNRPDVLAEITANIGSFGSWGSRVPYLERRVKVLRDLQDHPLSEVRMWAEQTISALEREMERETVFDEERELRV